MPDLSLKDIPEAVFMKLQQEAASHGRSVDREAVQCLTDYFSDRPSSPGTVLDEIRRGRQTLSKLHLTDSDLEQARREARS